MLRCQHKNMKIIEHKMIEVWFEFEDGQPPEDGYRTLESDPRLYRTEVECCDCGFQRFYKPDAKRPKWVQSAWDALMEAQKFKM